jgi:hypothetical protein
MRRNHRNPAAGARAAGVCIGACALLLGWTGGCVTGAHHADGHSHDLGGPVDVTTPPLQRMYEFHGHLGPYIVLGFRAGMLAREMLESPGYFDLDAKAVCPLKTPTSCFLDGIQMGSGCTLGKCNLSVTDGPSIACRFTSKKGRGVEVRLKDGLPAKIAARIASDGVEATGHAFFTAPVEELFVVTRL